MKKKVVLAATLCCAIIMAGCGKTAPGAPDAPNVEVSIEDPETPKAAESITAASEENTAAAPEESTFDDSDYGEKLIPDADGRISSGFMSIAMPKELEGTYAAYSYDSDINIYDKESMEAGYGGFAFGVCATEDYGSYGGMRTKIGELTAADGTLYHVLLYYPSDVQWDYSKSEEPESYNALYNYGAEVSKTIKAENGGIYADGAGTKGEDIYGDLVKDIVEKIRNAKSSQELQDAGLSALYYDMTQGDTPIDPMEFIGIAYVDINLDGIDEMVIAETETNRVYDIFTSVNGVPAHVVSGSKLDYYKINGSMIFEYIEGDMDVDLINCFDLMPNETEIVFQYGLEINNAESAENKWSICYSDEKYEPMTEEEFNERMAIIQNVLPENDLDFIPLGQLK